MARAAKKTSSKKAEVVEEELEELEDLEDLEDEPVEDEDDEAEDEDEDEEDSPSPKAKSKKTKKRKTRDDGMIGSAELAEALGTSGRELRVMLRQHKVEKNENNRYEWESVEDAVEEMGFKSIAAAKKGLAESRAQRLDELKERVGKNKAAKKKTAKKSSKKVVEEDDEEDEDDE